LHPADTISVAKTINIILFFILLSFGNDGAKIHVSWNMGKYISHFYDLNKGGTVNIIILSYYIKRQAKPQRFGLTQ
jgi:hypothetical protein